MLCYAVCVKRNFRNEVNEEILAVARKIGRVGTDRPWRGTGPMGQYWSEAPDNRARYVLLE